MDTSLTKVPGKHPNQDRLAEFKKFLAAVEREWLRRKLDRILDEQLNSDDYWVLTQSNLDDTI